MKNCLDCQKVMSCQELNCAINRYEYEGLQSNTAIQKACEKLADYCVKFEEVVC